MESVITMRETAELLGRDPLAVRELARAGVFGATIKAGNQVLLDPVRVAAVAALPELVGPHPRALVVRVSVAIALDPADDPSWPERRWLGFKTDLSPIERADAVRGWWSIEDPEGWVGHVLVATLRGLVVAVYAIEGFETVSRRSRRFIVTEPSQSQERPFTDHWLRTGPGGPIRVLEARG